MGTLFSCRRAAHFATFEDADEGGDMVQVGGDQVTIGRITKTVIGFLSNLPSDRI